MFSCGSIKLWEVTERAKKKFSGRRETGVFPLLCYCSVYMYGLLIWYGLSVIGTLSYLSTHLILVWPYLVGLLQRAVDPGFLREWSSPPILTYIGFYCLWIWIHEMLSVSVDLHVLESVMQVKALDHSIPVGLGHHKFWAETISKSILDWTSRFLFPEACSVPLICIWIRWILILVYLDRLWSSCLPFHLQETARSDDSDQRGKSVLLMSKSRIWLINDV